jgi:hypothetical protein
MASKSPVALVAMMALVALPFLGGASLAGGIDCSVTALQAAGPVYLLVDGANNAWIYLESNGQAGLQRGGAGPAEPALVALNGSPTGAVVQITDTDTCQESATPDTLIF